MIQRFIELGEGYGDIYELRELMMTNRSRFMHGFVFITKDMDGKPVLSVAAAFKPAEQGNFMPIYICREGIPENSKRLDLFEETVKELGGLPIHMDVKHSRVYADRQFYFSHLISVLRLNHYIPPMQ
ncbi:MULTISPECIES: methylthioribose kinase [Planococcaceae]|uniref:Methylthioribose kinase n=1 Tax=Planococcus halotolerans TaxID=2233542 RepID=A0A365L2T0_9BACL|nr:MULTISPECIES: methylthioribose kinase [Planococcaceae]QHJ70867.1 methylthioribose kinase [Planococcus halotolerans]RAZ79379.1 methylthioribose kinase [Planococcus halotolerans]RLQ92866.1 methylthioribose kinase [Planomicrobium sp. Y74]